MTCDTSEILTIFYYAKIGKNLLFVVVPIIFIILGVIDLFKAVTTGDNDDLNSATYNIMKRIIISGLLMVTPFLVNLILGITGIGTYDECFAQATLDNIDKLREKELIEWEIEQRRREEEESISVSPGVHKKEYNGMEYFEIIPPNPKPNMALVIFLHGDTGDFELVKTLHPFTFVKSGDAYVGEEFIFIAPRSVCHNGACDWKSDSVINKLMGVIGKVQEDYKIDSTRIYMTGHSRGGIGVWNVVNKYPNKFAAAMIMSGDTGGTTLDIEKWKHIPTRVFNGTYQNDNWCYTGSKSNCDAIANAGGKCTFYPVNVSHGDTPKKAYTKENIRWLLSQKRR